MSIKEGTGTLRGFWLLGGPTESVRRAFAFKRAPKGERRGMEWGDALEGEDEGG
jgi:hypothetical protein